MASSIEFIKKRSSEVLAFGLLAFSLLCIASFLTYNPEDPSFNNVTNNVPTNLGGELGAFITSPILSLFGLGSILFILIPPAWSWIIFHEKCLPKWWLRMTMLILCLPSISSSASMFDTWFNIPEIWPSDSYGGIIGLFIKNDLTPILTLPGLAIVSLVLTVVTFFFATGLLKHEWAAIFSLIYNAISKTSHLLQQAYEYITSLRNKDRPKKVKKKKASSPPVKSRSRIETPRRKPSMKGSKDTQTSLDLKSPNSYTLPPLTLLRTPPARQKKNQLSESALEQNAKMLEKVLDDFGINGSIVKIRPGPVVTLYELEPSPGTKSSRVIGLSDDIARSMSAVSARIAVVPGQNVIGIELPNTERETIYFRTLLETDEYEECNQSLAMVMGKTIDGEPYIIDLAKMPHLLIAGTTGSGKSVGINAMIISLLYRYTPDECRFIMVDPKMLELSVYDGIPHLLSPVVTEPGKAVVALKWAVKEMENRYRLMSNLSVRNIAGYNDRIIEAKSKGEELMRTVQTGYDIESGKPTFEKVPIDMVPLPFIVVIVDEMADLMAVAGKDIELSVQRLAQMARAAGIHIIMATQRPSVDVITGIIKANFPTRISFQVTSRIDSRTILGEAGAEQLLGMGDMLHMAGGSRITRVHGPFVDDKEVEKVVNFWKKQGEPTYVEDVTVDEEGDGFSAGAEGGGESTDDLYNDAVEIVCRDGRASTSYVQRCLKIGYNRAANIIEQMEKDGIVSPPNNAGKREVLSGQ